MYSDLDSIQMFKGKRISEDSNIGTPIYADITNLFNNKFVSSFEGVYLLVDYLFDCDLVDKSEEDIIDAMYRKVLSDLRIELSKESMQLNNLYLKLSGSDKIITIDSLDPLLIQSSNSF